MTCENCFHECTVVDFVTLRNLCEHLYLDALAKKHDPFLDSATSQHMIGGRFQNLLPNSMDDVSAREELLALEQ